MKNKFRYRLFLGIIILSLSSCSVFHKGKKETIEDFDQFYNRFHSDPAFQMSRINFPIRGKMIDGDNEKTWTKSNWALLKVKIYDVDKKKYKVSYKKTEKSFVEKFWLENSGFSSEYIFEVIDNKWMLVYALDVNI
ncbi:MAG: DUF4348 domain-containing protein [Saprospiraceae bacterium]|nr:DUF4348 domain-containing protein [Saprospiraceae bacterium]MBL0023499.1 DUF4348 domain-containing protein [Saprospiraceae bacterium]